jgi:hypothetical protein
MHCPQFETFGAESAGIGCVDRWLAGRCHYRPTAKENKIRGTEGAGIAVLPRLNVGITGSECICSMTLRRTDLITFLAF